MPRWNEQETRLMEQMRERLADKFARSAQYPEVIGDRKLIRFLRGHFHDLDKACEMMEKFLDWRHENKVDAIRKDIVDNGLDAPEKFPFGELVLRLTKTVVLNTEKFNEGFDPVTVESYVAPTIWNEISVDDYIQFRIYCLEYVSMILEQLSEIREQELKAKQENTEEPYGYIQRLYAVRDLNGMSMFNFTPHNQAIARRITMVSSDNYPELLKKAFVVNTPWIFNTIFSFFKLFLPAATIAKVNVCGANFLEQLNEELGAERVPDFIGGACTSFNGPFQFKTEEGEALWYKA